MFCEIGLSITLVNFQFIDEVSSLGVNEIPKALLLPSICNFLTSYFISEVDAPSSSLSSEVVPALLHDVKHDVDKAPGTPVLVSVCQPEALAVKNDLGVLPFFDLVKVFVYKGVSWANEDLPLLKNMSSCL